MLRGITRGANRRAMERRALERRGSVLYGCLIAAGVVLVLLIGLGIWVAFSWRGWFASASRAAMHATIQSMELSADQSTTLTSHVDAVLKDFEDGKVTMEQMGLIVKEGMEGPLVSAGVVCAADARYVQKSGLSPEDKAATKQELQRVVRGMTEKSITGDQVQTKLMPIIMTGPMNNQKFKTTLKDDEVKDLRDEAKKLADKAGIPDEPFVVDFVKEFDAAVERAKSGKMSLSKPAVPPATKPEAKPETKPESKPESKPDTKPAEPPSPGTTPPPPPAK